MKILIVKLSAIGDVIHTLPALNALRRKFPRAQITWLVEEAASELLVGHPALDRVLVSKRKRWLKGLRTRRAPRHLRAIVRFLRDLRDTRYHWIFDFQALLKSGIWIFMAKGTQKVGFGPGMEHMEHSYLFLNRRIPAVSMEVHALERGLMLIEAVGVPRGKIEYRLPVKSLHRQAVGDRLTAAGVRGQRPLVAIHPIAKWETKLWSEQRFGRLADWLTESFNYQVVFTGGAEDCDAVNRIRATMFHPAANMAGRTGLLELAALYERSALAVFTDTGPMHLAAAVGTPLVGLFGPTAPWRTGPYGDNVRIVRTGQKCSPCFKRRCPNPSCMGKLTVERVMAEISDLLQELGVGNS